jgi:zinc ribbon protein
VGIVSCPSCGTAVSDPAQSCPACGRPIEVGTRASGYRLDEVLSKFPRVRDVAADVGVSNDEVIKALERMGHVGIRPESPLVRPVADELRIKFWRRHFENQSEDPDRQRDVTRRGGATRRFILTRRSRNQTGFRPRRV